MPIIVNVDVMLARRKMRLNTLAELVGISPQNLSVLNRPVPGRCGSAPWNGSAKCWIASRVTCWRSKRVRRQLRRIFPPQKSR